MIDKHRTFFSTAVIAALLIVTTFGVVLVVPAQRYSDQGYQNQGYQNRGYQNRGYQNRVRLTGTYRLDSSRSENSAFAAERATRGLPMQERERVRGFLERRLQAPEMLALQRSGRDVSIASTIAPQASFTADGITRTEQTRRGRTVRVNAALRGDQLVVSSTGDRGNDYRVTFDQIDNGQRLRVIRQMDVEALTRPVSVTSIYDKTSDVAQLDVFVPRQRGGVRDSHQLSAVLNNDLSTRVARAGDRFTLTVQSPGEYDGAVIDGTVSNVDRSGRVSGRAQLNLNLDRIRLRQGRSYPFNGYIESVRTPDGDDVNVDSEGRVSDDDSQTGRTLTRAGIGSAIGAIIGAVAGGGKGAAIGAGVGAGAGAGSVFIQGRDDLNLRAGTRFTLRTDITGPEASR